MKKLLLFLSLLVASIGLTRCTMYPYPAPPRQFVDIPLRHHRHDVKVYLDGEKPENQEYYKVIGMDASSYYGSFGEILNSFKVQGQRAGVDAVLLIGPAHSYPPEPTFFSAVGIKYRDSLTYVREYIKRKDVYIHRPDGTTSLVYEASFNLKGEELANTAIQKDTTYRRYVRHYSLDYLLHDTWRWRFETDMKGNIVKRVKFAAPNTPELICTYEYNQLGNVSAIKIIIPAFTNKNNARIRERMVLNYNNNQVVTEKLIYNRKGRLYRKEILLYDELGRIQQTTLYALKSEQEVPLVSTLYHYYTMDDLPPVTKGL